MMTGWARGAMLLVVTATMAGAPGCKTTTKPIVIKDDTPARMDAANKLAAQAEAAAKAGKADKAIELYGKSLEESQDLFFVWNNLGTLLMQKGDYMNAAEAFKSAADLAPKDPRPYYNIGVVYQKVVYDQQALEYFLKSLERQENYLPALRGAIAAGQRLVIVDEDALVRVRRFLMIETDPQWRKIAETEQLRLENELKNRRAVTNG